MHRSSRATTRTRSGDSRTTRSARPTRIARSTAAIAAAGSLLLGVAACSDNDDGSDETSSAGADENTAFESRLDAEANPTAMLADGVSIAPGSTLFKTAGIGPAALNDDAEEGDPLQFVDPALLVDGELPDGMTPTEAQGLVVLAQIRERLQDEGLDVQDVATMRVFLAGDGDEDPDFAGWNRAYKQYYANTDLSTVDPQQLARGTSEDESDPLVVNPTRPTRFAFGISAMAVDGWLVEVEVDAYSPAE